MGTVIILGGKGVRNHFPLTPAPHIAGERSLFFIAMVNDSIRFVPGLAKSNRMR